MCAMKIIGQMLIALVKGDLQMKCLACVCNPLPTKHFLVPPNAAVWPPQLVGLQVSCQGGTERLGSMRPVNGFYGFLEYLKLQLLIIECCLDTVAIYTF